MLTFFTVILSCQLLGEILVVASGLPLLGPVVGMALLFIGLLFKGGIPEGLDRMADGLLSHLSLLFVPAGVGVIVHFHRIAADWVAIVAALLLGTVITLAVTALTMQMTGRWLRGQGDVDG